MYSYSCVVCQRCQLFNHACDLQLFAAARAYRARVYSDFCKGLIVLLLVFSGAARTIIGGGRIFIYASAFCLINFFWNRLCLQSVNKNIWIFAPSIIVLLAPVLVLRVSCSKNWTLYRGISNTDQKTNRKKLKCDIFYYSCQVMWSFLPAGNLLLEKCNFPIFVLREGWHPSPRYAYACLFLLNKDSLITSSLIVNNITRCLKSQNVRTA